MFRGTALLISGDEGERGHFADVLRSLEWALIRAASVPEALRTLTTLDADLLLLTESAKGMSLLTGLRVLCEVAPNVPVALVLPDDRMADFGSLPAAGLLRRSAPGGEVSALIEASLRMQPTKRAAVRPGAHPVPAESMRIALRHAADAVVLTPEDRLDLIGYADLEERLDALAGEGRRAVVLDLSEVTVLSSACFAVLMRFWADFETAGGRFAIARPTDRAAAAIGACNLDRIIPVHATLEEAVAAVGKGRESVES